MNPNDLVVYNKTIKDFTTEVVQPQKYLSWTEGKLVFRNDPLDVIARRLERWYNIDVEVEWRHLTENSGFVQPSSMRILKRFYIYLKRSLPIDYRIEEREM